MTNYSYVMAAVNSSQLLAEARAAIARVDGIQTSGTQATIRVNDPPLSGPEKSALDAVIAAHDPGPAIAKQQADQQTAAAVTDPKTLAALCALVDALRQSQPPPAWAVQVIAPAATAANAVQQAKPAPAPR